MEQSPLERIVGQQLVAVCFVLDYVQFQFGTLVLAALTSPILVESSIEYRRQMSDYRNALCRQIGSAVESISDTAEGLEILLTGGYRLLIDLTASDCPGPEMATLSVQGRFITCMDKTSIGVVGRVAAAAFVTTRLDPG